MVGQGGEELGLAPGDPEEAAEALEMRWSDGGDDPDLGSAPSAARAA
jgi:hypothetical protein